MQTLRVICCSGKCWGEFWCYFNYGLGKGKTVSFKIYIRIFFCYDSSSVGIQISSWTKIQLRFLFMCSFTSCRGSSTYDIVLSYPISRSIVLFLGQKLPTWKGKWYCDIVAQLSWPGDPPSFPWPQASFLLEIFLSKHAKTGMKIPLFFPLPKLFWDLKQSCNLRDMLKPFLVVFKKEMQFSWFCYTSSYGIYGQWNTFTFFKVILHTNLCSVKD